MATHSSILAWRIPTDIGGLGGYSPGGRTESNTTELLNIAQPDRNTYYTQDYTAEC